MLFKRKLKRSQWMEGLLLAERLNKDEDCDVPLLWHALVVDVRLIRPKVSLLFVDGFKDYIYYLQDKNNAI